ncbi:hypothetical protein M758_8G050500 [Ceratodon purpureus]|nr:hypothetical protein M758_8G050500 [Ceratodon purpureus]
MHRCCATGSTSCEDSQAVESKCKPLVPCVLPLADRLRSNIWLKLWCELVGEVQWVHHRSDRPSPGALSVS